MTANLMKLIYIIPFLTIVLTAGCSHRMSKRYPAFQFDNGDDYVVEGMYRIVDESGRIGYADERGNTVIVPRFAGAFPFENGRAMVTDSCRVKEVERSHGEYHKWESDKWYYIDKKGRRLGD